MSTVQEITPAMIRSWFPGAPRDEPQTEERLLKFFDGRNSATLTDILQASLTGVLRATDALWAALQQDVLSPDLLRLFVYACAERRAEQERTAGRKPDERSLKAIEVVRRFARGKATEEELRFAHARAANAATAASIALSVVGDDSWSAMNVAHEAARSAARAAAGNIAWAARMPVHLADGAEEERWQVEYLLALLTEPGRTQTKEQ